PHLRRRRAGGIGPPLVGERGRIGPGPDQPVTALRGAQQGRTPCAPRAVPGSRLRAPDRSSSGGHLRGLGEAGRRLLIAGGAFAVQAGGDELPVGVDLPGTVRLVPAQDRKSTRLNSSHVSISYAVFCLKKKKD